MKGHQIERRARAIRYGVVTCTMSRTSKKSPEGSWYGALFPLRNCARKQSVRRPTSEELGFRHCREAPKVTMYPLNSECPIVERDYRSW